MRLCDRASVDRLPQATYAPRASCYLEPGNSHEASSRLRPRYAETSGRAPRRRVDSSSHCGRRPGVPPCQALLVGTAARVAYPVQGAVSLLPVSGVASRQCRQRRAPFEPTTLRCRSVCGERLTHLDDCCGNLASDLAKHWNAAYRRCRSLTVVDRVSGLFLDTFESAKICDICSPKRAANFCMSLHRHPWSSASTGASPTRQRAPDSSFAVVVMALIAPVLPTGFEPALPP